MIKKKVGKRYTVKNLQRYVGESGTIRYFSKEERDFLEFLEKSPKVVHWYKVSTDDIIQKYNVVYKEDDGRLTENLIKVVPKEQPKKKKASSHKQGYYKLRNPDKYRGNTDNVRFMSSWELNVHKFLDSNPNIIEWASEEIVIPYIKPTDGKVHRYYIDYYVKYQKSSGEIVQELWEVKPKRETMPPTRKGKKSQKTILYEQVTYAVNKAKWQSAVLFAKQHGMVFKLITEDHIFK